MPNFFPEAQVKTWPAWAQRRLVLGLDLQGGSYLLLEVDSNYVKKEQARPGPRRRPPDAARCQDRVHRRLAVRSDAVEVRITKDTDVQSALAKLRELSQPLGGLLGSSGQRNLEVTDAGGGVIRLTIPQAAMTDRMRKTIEQSIQIVERRVNELGTVEPVIQRQGNDRILVQVPGLQDPTRLKELLGKTAKMEFRMVDATVPPDQAQQGQGAAGLRSADERDAAEDTLCGQEAGAGLRRRPDRRAAGLRPALRRADRQLPASTPRARASSRRRRRKMSGSPSRSCSTTR